MKYLFRFLAILLLPPFWLVLGIFSFFLFLWDFDKYIWIEYIEIYKSFIPWGANSFWAGRTYYKSAWAWIIDERSLLKVKTLEGIKKVKIIK